MADAPDDPKAIPTHLVYSRKDRVDLDAIRARLGPLRDEGLVAGLAEHAIEDGNDWIGAMGARIAEPRLYLLLVSPDYLASEYCYDVEFTRVLAEQDAGRSRAIPVILRPCDWHAAPFRRFPPLPADGKPISKWRRREAALDEVARGAREAATWLRHREETDPERPGPATPAGLVGVGVHGHARALELEIPRDRTLNADEIVQMGDAIRSLRQLGVDVRVVRGERP